MYSFRNFNVTPIKTPFANPSNAMSTLKSKVIVIHGCKDNLCDAEQVELVTKLAIKEKWAPPGMLSFYDNGEGHLSLLDSPAILASTYRKAFEEQVFADESDSLNHTKADPHESGHVEVESIQPASQ